MKTAKEFLKEKQGHIEGWETHFIGQDVVERYLNEYAQAKDARIAEMEKEREWISVNDRLPEDMQLILFYSEVAETYCKIEVGMYSKTENHLLGMTHWMPLPLNPTNKTAQGL